MRTTTYFIVYDLHTPIDTFDTYAEAETCVKNLISGVNCGMFGASDPEDLFIESHTEYVAE